MKTQQSLDTRVEDAPANAMFTPRVQLTTKETQALEWCLKGKTTWEIARIQSCSESTINFHFSISVASLPSDLATLPCSKRWSREPSLLIHRSREIIHEPD